MLSLEMDSWCIPPGPRTEMVVWIPGIWAILGERGRYDWERHVMTDLSLVQWERRSLVAHQRAGSTWKTYHGCFKRKGNRERKACTDHIRQCSCHTAHSYPREGFPTSILMCSEIPTCKAKRSLALMLLLSGDPAKTSSIPEGPISVENPLVNTHSKGIYYFVFFSTFISYY